MGKWATHPVLPNAGPARCRRGRCRPDSGAGSIAALDHPERGVVAHDDCVALAEQTGLVLSIGPWMLRQACEQLRAWRDQLGVAAPPVRVDLSSYLTDLVSVVRGALDATQHEPQDIALGMPVEVVVASHGDAVDNVCTLADIGVGTVLTRYGQAVGNLTLLESLPVRGVELAGSLCARPRSPIRCWVARWPVWFP